MMKSPRPPYHLILILNVARYQLLLNSRYALGLGYPEVENNEGPGI